MNGKLVNNLVIIKYIWDTLRWIYREQFLVGLYFWCWKILNIVLWKIFGLKRRGKTKLSG